MSFHLRGHTVFYMMINAIIVAPVLKLNGMYVSDIITNVGRVLYHLLYITFHECFQITSYIRNTMFVYNVYYGASEAISFYSFK